MRRPGKSLSDAIPLLICLCLLAACYSVSRLKPFWFDEILTVFPVTMNSFWRIVTVCREPMNIAPPLYFWVAWLYVRVFGPSPLSLRLLSCIPICFSVLLLWRLSRRYMSVLGVTIGLLGAVSATVLVTQNSEARFYGLYLLSSTLLFYAFAVVNTARRDDTPPPSRPMRHGAVVFLASLLLIFTHTLGIFFIASLLVGQLLIDWNTLRQPGRRFLDAFNPWVYLGCTLAVIIFTVTWLPTMLSQQHAFHGMSNVEKPSAGLLIRILFDDDRWRKIFCAVPILLFLGIMVAGRRRAAPEVAAGVLGEGVSRFDETHKFLIMGGCYQLVAPLLMYFASYAGTGFLSQRYVFPHWIGWVVVTAWVIDYCVRQSGPRRQGIVHGICALYALIFAAQFVVETRGQMRAGRLASSNIARLKAAVRAHPEADAGEGRLPVVYSDAIAFVPAYFYRQEAKPLFVLSDVLKSRDYSTEYVNIIGLHSVFGVVPVVTKQQMDGYDDFVLYDAEAVNLAGRYFAVGGRYTLKPVCLVPQSEGGGAQKTENTIHVYRVHKVRR